MTGISSSTIRKWLEDHTNSIGPKAQILVEDQK